MTPIPPLTRYEREVLRCYRLAHDATAAPVPVEGIGALDAVRRLERKGFVEVTTGEGPRGGTRYFVRPLR